MLCSLLQKMQGKTNVGTLARKDWSRESNGDLKSHATDDNKAATRRTFELRGRAFGSLLIPWKMGLYF